MNIIKAIKDNTTINIFTPLKINWSKYEGFELKVIDLECSLKQLFFHGAVFSIELSKDSFSIELLFIHFNISSPFLIHKP